jgi:hypothetical protein
MDTVPQVLLAIAAVTAVSVLIYRTIRAYKRYRGKLLVTCPENRQVVAVEVDAAGAAITAATGGPKLVLTDCTRWPERQGCGQACLSQIELSPENCQVRTVLDRWFEGRKCAYCGRVLGEVRWQDHKPALLTPQRELVEWSSLAVEELPRLLETHSAACHDCLTLGSADEERTS